ncbi:hypothetical protein DFH08DRAFT_809078 [Mycena albidolilacea]|uniref:Uncharacterized protein n=1 Tax=Mycena albidolilacea TaxID=1033008 RepID=A0AAD7EQX1_9AGAR|nr:hypothetical protein DFH08DRAFT_809078 [Mycena albidolilacea]
MLFASLLSSLVLLSPALAVSINNTLYIITNSERPPLSRPGLSPIGWQRAQDCIPRFVVLCISFQHHSDSPTFDLFIPSRIQLFADLNLGLILVCKPNIKTGACLPANATAAPLAASLGFVPDIHCGTGEEADDDCVGDTLRKYAKNSTQSILVVWDSNEMDDLLENIDIELPEGDDDDDDDGEDDEDDLAIHADIVLIKNLKKKVVETSMNCTGIDGQALRSF